MGEPRGRSRELEIDTHTQQSQPSADDAARIAARAMDAKKAHDVTVLDVSRTLGVCDWFVIGSGASPRQVKAIVDAAEEALLGVGLKSRVREGREDARWVLLDYGDVVVHVFLEEARGFYKLEKLWSDSPRLDWRDAAAAG